MTQEELLYKEYQSKVNDILKGLVAEVKFLRSRTLTEKQFAKIKKLETLVQVTAQYQIQSAALIKFLSDQNKLKDRIIKEQQKNINFISTWLNETLNDNS
jgi:serine/threonine protein kinase HipA of HipAB toxin-antitoxin module